MSKAIRVEAAMRIAQGKRTIKDWLVGLEGDPANALAWSGRVFAAAAEVEVWTEIDNMTHRGADELLSYCVAKALARTPSSSSAQSNLMDSARRDSWSAAVDFLRPTRIFR